MEENVKDFIDFLKLPPNILGALSIASGILLFLPNNIMKKFYMLEFREKYGFTIGIVFLVSLSILIVLIITKIYKYFSNKILKKRLPKVQIKYLKGLNTNQIELIKEFLSDPTYTLTLPVNNGLVIGLQHFNVITPAGQNHLVDMIDPQIKYFLQPWVVKRINEDDELRVKFYG